MRGGRLGPAAAIALGLALPASAAAADWQIQPGEKTCGGSDKQCGSPNDLAANPDLKSGQSVDVSPGTYTGDANFKVPLTITGTGSGVATFSGSIAFGLPLGDMNPTILKRLVISSRTDNASALTFSNNTGDVVDHSVEIESTVLSGKVSGNGLRVITLAGAKTINVTARHVTIADSGSAPAAALTGGSGNTPTATFFDSIIFGDITGSVDTKTNNNDVADKPTDGDKSSRFVDFAAEDFHLRAHAIDVDAGRKDTGGEIKEDIDGDGRPFGSAWDQGADEFVEHGPSNASASATPTTAVVGQGVQFDASVTDPDVGDSLTYSWDFGDGSPPSPGASVGHSYAAPGNYVATVTITDSFGQSTTAQAGVTVVPFSPGGGGSGGSGSVTPLPRLGSTATGAEDTFAPGLSIVTPRNGQRLRLGRKVPTLRGRVSDDTGVRRVELILVRKRKGKCQWFDGRKAFRTRSCLRPRWFRARVDDFAWHYSFLKGVRPSPGTYSMAVRATDVLGNRTATASVAARTAVTFRFVR